MDIILKMGDTDSSRFVLLAIWSFSLLISAGLGVTAGWLAAMGAGLFLTHVLKKPVQAKNKAGYHPSWVEMLIISIWGIGPALVYLSSHPEKFTISTIMLACGFLIILGRYRSSARPALLVATPYVILSIWFLVQSFGTGSALYIASLMALLFGTFVTMTVHSVRTHREMLELSQERERLIQELESSKTEAVQSASFKSRFLANMSHEIRTPLNGVIGMAEVVKQGQLNSEQRAHMEVITNCGKSLLGIINDILDLSKIEADGLSLRPATFDIYKELDHLNQVWLPQAKAKGLGLEFRTDTEMPALLHADIDRIKQCLNNLIGNAVKFTKTGHITVSTTFKVHGETGALVVQITDTGVGIDAGFKDLLFTPFTQADVDLSADHGGTGLGLTITKSLCELMGGGITVDSKPGRGSRFTIWFGVDIVAKTAPVIKTEHPSGVQASMIGGRKILVADDIDYNFGVIRSLIEPLGAQVSHARNGEEAVEMINSEAFDIVFMDVRMPIMDGVTATRLLRENPGPGQNIPIIAFTGNAMPEDVARFKEAGMDGHFPKPVTFRSVMDILERYLPRQQSGAEGLPARSGVLQKSA